MSLKFDRKADERYRNRSLSDLPEGFTGFRRNPVTEREQPFVIVADWFVPLDGDGGPFVPQHAHIESIRPANFLVMEVP